MTPPGCSTVEVLLEADGEGTHLRLIHRDLPSAESAEKHGHGWRHYLDRLAVVAAGEDPGPDAFGSRHRPATEQTTIKETDDGQSNDVVRSGGKGPRGD